MSQSLIMVDGLRSRSMIYGEGLTDRQLPRAYHICRPRPVDLMGCATFLRTHLGPNKPIPCFLVSGATGGLESDDRPLRRRRPNLPCRPKSSHLRASALTRSAHAASHTNATSSAGANCHLQPHAHADTTLRRHTASTFTYGPDSIRSDGLSCVLWTQHCARVCIHAVMVTTLHEEKATEIRMFNVRQALIRQV